jgi:hypothetical protein
MSRISLLVKLNRDGIAKLADESMFRIDPDQLEAAAEWSPGTEIVIQEKPDHDGEWPYKLFSSGGGIPVSAAPYSADS